MKEFKVEEQLLLDKAIWKLSDILRSESGFSSTNDYYVVLFLLSAYKDGLLSDQLFDGHEKLIERLINQLDVSKSDFSIQYFHIAHSFEPLIQRLSKDGLRDIFNVLFSINRQVLTENFPDMFDSVLYRISQSQGGYAGQFIQPLELTRFICTLADLKKDAKVFNPFSGLASFGVYLNPDQKYFGQELNRDTWALGALRLMAYGRQVSSNYVCADSISHWPSESQKFDLIISNPPFGLRINTQRGEIQSTNRTVEQFLIEKGIQSLSANGKLIALLPKGFLFKENYDQQLRKLLVDEDLLDTVISLPGGLLSNTGIPLIILVINKNKERTGKVRFIKADKFVDERSSRDKVLNDFALSSLILDFKEDDDVSRLVDNAEIQAFDYNLDVPRYFQKKIEHAKNEQLFKLKDILEYIRGQKGNLPENGKFVRIRNLKDDKVDYTLDIYNIEEIGLTRPDIHLVSESCILLAVRWKTLKPTLFEFLEEPIFKNQDIFAFRINDTIVEKAYLINELHADYIKEQLQAIRMGAAIPFIRRDDLMEVVIKLPSLEEQRAKVQAIYELSDKIKNLQAERDALALGKSIKQFNEFASLKHTLGRPRQNILDWSDNLLDFLIKKQEGFESLNKSFVEFYDTDIISVLKEIKQDVNFITDVLEKGENGLVLSEYEKQIIPLSDINNIINELSNNGLNFKIKKLLIKGEKLKERGIDANITLLKTLLDNLLTNAKKYAFDKMASGNEVAIELTEVDDFLSIEIRNNGKPFPKNFDREKFITKYSTANSSNGSGLGGYDIHRIATDFNNSDWILSLSEDPFFPVKFKFKFPITLIN